MLYTADIYEKKILCKSCFIPKFLLLNSSTKDAIFLLGWLCTAAGLPVLSRCVKSKISCVIYIYSFTLTSTINVCRNKDCSFFYPWSKKKNSHNFHKKNNHEKISLPEGEWNAHPQGCWASIYPLRYRVLCIRKGKITKSYSVSMQDIVFFNVLL